MYKFIAQIIGVGLLLGLVATVITMVFGITIYYGVELTELFLPAYFLNYAAWVSLAVGLLCTLAWFIYIIVLARWYFVYLLKEFSATIKEKKE